MGRLLKSLAAALMAQSVLFVNPTVAGGGGGAETLLFTANLVKTDGNTVDTGAIPDSLGLGFKQGDMPSGEWPVLRNNAGTEIPYTYWGVNTWADGSMKMIKVLPRIPEAITGTTGTLYPVKVYNGGSAPSTTTALALSDAPDFNVVLTGITNLTGDWTSSLAQGRTDNDKVRTLGQGPVGIYAAIGQEYRDASSNHAHLECEHYVMILQDASGGHYGTRHMGHTMQPHVDVASPTYRTFSAVKKVGASTIRTLNGTNSDATTHTTTLVCAHYSGFMDVGTDAKMDFVAGSRAAEAALRWQHDMAYWVTTGLLPPYDLAITGINANSSCDYYPYGRDPLTVYNMSNTGERPEIAVWPSWIARFVFKQTATDERVLRIGGLVPAGWRQTYRLAATRKPPVLNNGPDNAGGTYTGLGTSRPTWYYRPGNGAANGILQPAATSSNWNSEDTTDHRCSPSFAPWLFTGEWQYLDLLIDYVGSSTSYLEGTGSFNAMPWTGDVANWFYRHLTVNGTTYYNGGGSFFMQGQPQRQAAWYMNALGQALAACPDTDPAGTAIKDYFEDSLDGAIDAFVAFHALQDADWQGINYARAPNQPSEAPWAHGYHLGAAAHIKAITGKTNAQNYMNYLALFFKRIADRTTSFAQAYSYTIRSRDQSGTVIEVFTDLLTSFSGGDGANQTVQTPNTTNDTYTNSGGFGYWTPTNGDRWATKGATHGPIRYLVNVSGNTYQLAATPGGSPIDITDATVINDFYLDPQNFSGQSFVTYTTAQDYPATITGALRFAAAAGCTTLGDALTKTETQMAINQPNYSNDPKVAFKDSFA